MLFAFCCGAIVAKIYYAQPIIELIALFALVGAMGAMAAPLAGRLADAGHTHRTSLLAMLLATLSFLPALIHPAYSVIGLAVTGVVLDSAVRMNMVLGQRSVYALDAASRGRLPH